MVLVGSEDYGRDEQTAQVYSAHDSFIFSNQPDSAQFRSIFQSLLQRHAHIHDEIEAFRGDIRKLGEQSQLMNETSQTKKSEDKKVRISICLLNLDPSLFHVFST